MFRNNQTMLRDNQTPKKSILYFFMGELYDMQGLHCYVVYSLNSSFSQTYQKNSMSFNSVDSEGFV